MKRIYILILVAVLAVGGTAGVVIGIVGNDGESLFSAGPKYDQSSPVAAAKSFLQAMLNGDSEAFAILTKDVLFWQWAESDLISFATKNMYGWTIKDYSYYQKGTTIVAYNHSLNPSPEHSLWNNECFFGMDFAMADGKFYIIDLELPGYSMYSSGVAWDSLCEEAIANGCTKFQ